MNELLRTTKYLPGWPGNSVIIPSSVGLKLFGFKPAQSPQGNTEERINPFTGQAHYGWYYDIDRPENFYDLIFEKPLREARKRVINCLKGETLNI